MIYEVNSKYDVKRVLQTYNAIYGLDNLLPDEMSREFEYGSNGTKYILVMEFPGLRRFDATWVSCETFGKGTNVYTPKNYPAAFSKILGPNIRGTVISNETVNVIETQSKKEKDANKSNHGYDAVLKEMKDTYDRKNSDYGNSFEKALDEFGIIPGIGQIYHKFERVKKMVKSPNAKVNESMRDSLLDMCNYIAMTVAWMDKEGKENG
jgi:hypothetical protein